MQALFFQPVAGLSQALAMNAAHLDTKQASAQLRALGKNEPWGRANVTGPQTYEPAPEAASWQHNLGGFLRTFYDSGHSPNPYNDHRYFAQAPVLRSGWADAPDVARLIADRPGFTDALLASEALIAPGRYTATPWNTGLVARFACLLQVSGYDKRFPVLLDRDGRLLDGWHRLLACAQTGSRYFFLQLDF